MRRKLLLIGLDGATFTLLRPWAREGRLPNIKRLMEHGVHGNLRSTIPPITIPAWPAMFTGKNPGKIGVFNLLKEEDGKIKSVKTTSSSDCKGKRLWSYLSDNGLKSAVINVPATFPPDELNGFMISGLGASVKNDYTFPRELKGEINEIVEGYEIAFYGFHHGQVKRFLDMLYERTEKRKRLIMELLRRKEWDFGFVVFTGSDVIQHYLWDTYEKEHPLYVDDRHAGSMPDYWSYLDRAVGEIVAQAGDANVMLVSDHGFHGMRGRFNINDWLMQEGYLVLRHAPSTGSRLRNIGITRERAKSVMWKLNLHKMRKKLPNAIAERADSALKSSQDETPIHELDIDWERTRAYSFGYTGGIYFNKKTVRSPEEREELFSELSRKLGEIDNPLTGKKMQVQIFRREEIYTGDYVEAAPDMDFFIEGLRYTIETSVGHVDMISSLDRSKPSNATHDMNGIFIASGPDIKKGEPIEGADITDVTPTVLHAFGLPVPSDMDGKVLGIFKPDSGPGRSKVSTTEPGKDKERKSFGHEKEDEEKMKQQLKDLGYI